MAARILRKVSQVFTKSRDSPHSPVQAQHIPSNDNLSDNAPPSIPPPISLSEDIPRKILAFRTITTLLSRIQQEQAFRISESEETFSEQDNLELKLSSAFSTIAVIDHEIIAVVIERTRELLKVTACAQTSVNESSLTTTSPSGHISKAFRFIFAQNYRRDDTQSASSEPTIIDAMDNIDKDWHDDEKLGLWLEKCW